MELTSALYSFHGTDAVRHLFSVAAGLDSMIVGEAEVQGQVKRAYELALAQGATGPLTNRLFRAALAAGKRARTETGVSRSHVSVSTVAVELAAQSLGDLATRRVLVVGAGEQGELTARALSERGVHTIFVANRHYDRAIGLAQRFGGEAIRFEELPGELAQADIVVTCTSSPHQIVARDDMELVMEAREGRPIVVLDIAVPRDVDPLVRDLPGVALYDMDDLQREVARNLRGRESEATRARTLIDGDVAAFDRWLASLEVVPAITALRERGEAIVETVLRENESRWESLSDADRERLRTMARAIVSRMLHEPTMRLKGSVGEDDAYMYVSALRELFALDVAAALGEEPGADVTELDSRRRS
jgi:glutamyl-tRNA reductase